MTDDKVIRFPVIDSGGPNCDEAEVMLLLGRAADAGLVKIAVFGVDAEGEPFRQTNFNELEATGAHFNAALLYCTED